jgi:hypothetical protein
MPNHLVINDAHRLSNNDNDAEPSHEAPFDTYTAEAIAAIADLDDESRVEKMMGVGAAIVAAKDALPHGTLTRWYRDKLKRSESWCSQYCRLYQDRDLLQEALDWATRTSHRLAGCRGVEQLLKIIVDYKVKVLGADAPATRTPRVPKPLAAKALSEEISSQLHGLLADAEEDFEALREEAVTAPLSDTENIRETFLSLIGRVERRLRDLVETCTGMQVSETVSEGGSL